MEVSQALGNVGIPEDLKSRIEACLRSLESAQFAPGGTSEGAIQSHRAEIEAILKALEGAL